MINDVETSSKAHWHRRIAKIHDQAGKPRPSWCKGAQRSDEVCLCYSCGQSFDTPKALTLHLRAKHRVANSVKRLTFGQTACPACLKEFHATNRLEHHLDWSSEACYQACLAHADAMGLEDRPIAPRARGTRPKDTEGQEWPCYSVEGPKLKPVDKSSWEIRRVAAPKAPAQQPVAHTAAEAPFSNQRHPGG